MTKSQAVFIKYLRIRLECSWRVVYAMYVNRYYNQIPFDLKKQYHINQIKGRQLCRDAQILLNENWLDEY